MVPRDHNDKVGDEVRTVCHVRPRASGSYHRLLVGDTGVWLALAKKTLYDRCDVIILGSRILRSDCT